MPIFDRVLLAVLAMAALAAGTAASSADTRIFAVKTNRPGVTVERAALDGKELPVVGRGDGSTLFRIDRPNAAVPCANQILFVTSASERVDFSADLCALNWDVTLQLTAPAAPAAAAPEPAVPAAEPATPAPAEPQPSPPSEAAAPAEPEPVPESAPEKQSTGSSFSQTLSIATDDPETTITEVFFDGKPVAITAREGSAVKTEVTGDEKGIVCQRDLGLALSDGRRIARSVNICLNDWQLVVSLAGEPPAAPSTPETALPSPPPAPPVAAPEAALPVPPPAPPKPETALPVPAPAPAPVPAAPTPSAVAEPELAWMFSRAANQATLAYGVPETDDTRLVASCATASSRIKVQILAAASGVGPGSAVPITFAVGPFRKAYSGIAAPVSEMSGVSHPDLEIAVDDPLWQAVIHEHSMTAFVPGQPPAVFSLKGSAAPARQFLAACSPVPVAPPVVRVPVPLPSAGGAPRPGSIDVTYFCIDGSTLRVSYNGRLQTAVVIESGAPPIELRWIPGGGDRYVAGPARLVNRSGEVRFSRFGEPARVCQPR